MGTTAETATVLMSLGLLLVAAHLVGHQFARLGQPRVIGEIAGGLLLGPTVLGAVAPGLQATLFPQHGETPAVLGWTSQLGLLLLMFCSGAEMRAVFTKSEARVVGFVAVVGVAAPFCAGIAIFRFVDATALSGPAGRPTAVLVVFALALAVTSIPVISRILVDLGVMDTSFARVVLAVAVLEDTAVYVVLALTLGVVDDRFGLPARLGLDGGASGVTFHLAATVVVFGALMIVGPRAASWAGRQRWTSAARSGPIAYQLLFLFGGSLACLALGVTPIFGAFLAGVAVSAERAPSFVRARESIHAFSFAFFVPVYFATVGIQLDLLRELDLVFLGWFLALACVVKATSVFVGARLAGESARGARTLAIATNARGGPCIVLASVTFAAGIISAQFYTALVMLAIVTSMIAGTLLGRQVRSGRPLRDEPDPVRASAPSR